MGREAYDFQAEHFDSESCSVSRNGVDVRRCVGFDLSNECLIKLAGAPSGSKVSLELRTNWPEIDDGEDVPPGILLTVSNEIYLEEPNQVVIFLDGSSDVSSLYVKLVMFKQDSALKGIAGHMISKMVDGTLSFPNARRIKLWAAGGITWQDQKPGVRWGGYFAWPKYGFDCLVPNPTAKLFPHFPYYPPDLSHCKNVFDVLKCKGGKDFWRVAGDGDYMFFDLALGSLSRQVLDNFIENFGA